MSKLKGVLVNYNYDWRKIKRSYHVLQDKERAERWNKMKNKDYIKHAIWIPDENKLYLIMSNKSTLVVKQKMKRENDLLITILPYNKRRHPLKWIDVNLKIEPIDLYWNRPDVV